MAAMLGGKFVTTGGSIGGPGSAGTTDVASYDPVSDTWASLPSMAQPRCAHVAAASASKLYVFGGLTDCSNGGTTGPGLAAYDGSAWQTVTAGGAPPGVYNTSGTWTGSAFFVYGGANASPAVATGGLYTASTNTWTNANCALSGCERTGVYVTFNDGGFVKIFGGSFGTAPSGLQYELATGNWTGWTIPSGTPTVPERWVDDGRRIYLLVPGSGGCAGGPVINTFDRKTYSWLAADTASPPSGLVSAAAVAWVGGEIIAWSGSCGTGASSVGGRYQPPAAP